MQGNKPPKESDLAEAGAFFAFFARRRPLKKVKCKEHVKYPLAPGLFCVMIGHGRYF